MLLGRLEETFSVSDPAQAFHQSSQKNKETVLIKFTDAIKRKDALSVECLT